jgi:hypothetical protein
MDIIEFVEKFMHVELQEWQKLYIRKLYEVTRENDIRIVMGRGGRVYTYLTPKTLKELTQNGETANNSKQMSLVR